MSLVINTNIASLNAQLNLSGSQKALATSLARLSSGLRINNAADDPAGLAIADRFTTQINGRSAHLGPLEMRIALSDGQANIAFTSHSQVTREALEAAAPRLREMLSGQGLAHVNVDVSHQQFRDRVPQSTRYEPEFSFATGTAVASAGTPTTARAVASSLRLDAYA